MRAVSSSSLHRSLASAQRVCASNARRITYALVGSLTICLASASARAQEPAARPAPIIRSKSVEGFGPDAQLTGGIGFGLESKLDNFFIARARLGALYAAEPWIVNLGFTAEVGALAGLGWGGELELSRAGTLFGSAGVARVDESRWLAHLGVGFTIFGLEWQHVFGGSQPHNALMLEVRLPLGLWWLHKRQEKAEAESFASARPAAAPQIVRRPTSNPLPLVPGAPAPPASTGPQSQLQGPAAAYPTTGADAAAESGAAGEVSQAPAAHGGAVEDASNTPAAASATSQNAAPSGAITSEHSEPPSGKGAVTGRSQAQPPGRSPASADVAALELELAARMADAQSARERGDRLAEAMALSRAYALRPEPAVLLQLSAAELALGKPRSALADLQRAGDMQNLSAENRARAMQLRQQIAANLAQLRLSLTGKASEHDVVTIDGVAEPTAGRGYDVPLDPGEHKLQVQRGQRVLIERTFLAEPGKLLRLDVELPAE